MELQSGERIDQLYASNIQIIQSPEVFSFSLDAVLLANFPKAPKRGRIIDLCAGNGAVGLFLSAKTEAEIIGIELQEKLADMANRSIALNHLEEQVTMHAIDLKNAKQVVDYDSADLVVCNPPYFKELPASTKNLNQHFAIARHEIETSLEEVIAISAKLLKMNGRLAMVHRPERFIEIIELMKKYQLAPKRVQFVYPKVNKEANTVLIEAIHHGKTDGLRFLPPLFVYDDQNEYLPAVRKTLYGE